MGHTNMEVEKEQKNVVPTPQTRPHHHRGENHGRGLKTNSWVLGGPPTRRQISEKIVKGV